MKHIAAMALAVMLLLTACASNTPAENDPPAANGGAAVQTPSGETQAPQTPEEPEAPEEPDIPEEAPDPRLEAIDEILGSMTMEEKVGQLFFVRCPAESAVEDVSAYHLGGYLLFGRDFKDKTADQVTSAIASYQEEAAMSTPAVRSISITTITAIPSTASTRRPTPGRSSSAGVPPTSTGTT